MEEMFLLLAALLPAVVWGIYIYRKDRAEKEPLHLLMALIISGVVIIIPVVIMENAMRAGIYSMFTAYASLDNQPFTASVRYYWIYRLADNLIGIALVEEGWKWIAMWLITHRNCNFNSLFDGIVYAVYVSIGFAAAENIQYVLNFGWATAFARMVTAVPAHIFFAILMGACYSRWRMKKRPGQNLIRSIFLPVLAHGLYDYFCTYQDGWTGAAFWIFLAMLYLYCFYLTRKLSEEDHLIT